MEKQKIGNKVVEEIAMLDDTTCVLTFEPHRDKEEGILISTQVEYWIERDANWPRIYESWHYIDSKYDAGDGSYIEQYESVRLNEEEKSECREVMLRWMQENGWHARQKVKNEQVGKIRLKENFDDYERVSTACDGFIRSVVMESMDIAGGVDMDEIERLLAAYGKEKKSEIIHNVLNDARQWFDKFGGRYTLHMTDKDADTKIVSGDNLTALLDKAAKFYRHGKKPEVCIYDNVEKKDIVSWK